MCFAAHPPEDYDLAIDAVFGIGLSRAPEGLAERWVELLRGTPKTVLCVDVPSGLNADTGTWMPLSRAVLGAAGSRHTLALLALLLQHAGRVVTQPQLLRELWGPDHQDDTHYLRILVGKLRQKLGDDATAPRYIATEPGVGLKFVVRE